MARVDYQLIKEARFTHDLSQKMVSDKTGVSLHFIKHIETNRIKDPSLENLKKICNVLNLDINTVYQADFRETKTLLSITIKGGAGKSTILINLSFALAERGKRVLIIDADGQMNTSNCFGFTEDIEKSLYTALMEEEDLTNYIQPTKYENIDIVIADYELKDMDSEIDKKHSREQVFARCIKKVQESGKYDYIIIDTDTSLGLLTKNICFATDYALVPVECTAFGLKGLHIIDKFIKKRIHPYHEQFQLLGIVINKVKERRVLTELAEEELYKHWEGLLFKSTISDSASIEQSQWNDEPVKLFSKDAIVVEQFDALCEEVIDRAAKLVPEGSY